MRFSISLKKNHEFRRLYNKGKTASSQTMAVYCRRTGRDVNRLGITVSTKLGGAVQRNRIRRRLKEIYRINEQRFRPGHDIVIVARMKSRSAEFGVLEADVLRLFNKLGLLGELR